jgi:uncharacterized repeat protein (TIGR02543 family)
VNAISAKITVTANSKTRTYDGSALTDGGYTYTAGVLVTGDTLTAAVAGTQTDAGESANTVTSYVVRRGTADVTENYTFAASAPGTLTVSRRPVTLTSGSGSKTYDGSALTNHDVTVTGSGFASGEGASYDVTGSQLDKGSSKNTFTYTLNDNTKADNYTVTTAEGTLTVNAILAKITVTANSKAKTYDGSALTDGGYTYTAGVLVTGDTLTAIVAGTQTNAGESANTVTSYQVTRGGENITANYTFAASVPGTLTVSRRPVTLTSGSASKTYDGAALTNHDVTVTGDGFVSGEGASFTVTGSRLDAGSSANLFGYEMNTGTDAANYDVSVAAGTLTVDPIPAKITITANSKTKTYDGAALTDGGYAFTQGILLTGDTLTAIVAGTQTDAGSSQNAVASYRVTRGGSDITADYTFAAPAPGTLTVSRCPVTFTVTDGAYLYDGKPKSAAVTASTPSLAFLLTYQNSKGEAAEPTETGSYDIYAEITDPNYRHAGAADGGARRIGVLTIYAAAEPKTYALAFAGGDGATGTMADAEKAAAGAVRILPENKFTKDGWIFTGWSCSGGVYQPGSRFEQPAADTTMTAQWTQKTYSISGLVKENGDPAANATVTLKLGSRQIAQTTTDKDGKYSFSDVIPGTYNLVASSDGVVETIKKEVTAENVKNADITLPSGRTNSVVEVAAGTPDIVVGNLEQSFKQTPDKVYTEQDRSTVAGGGTVEIKLTAETASEQAPASRQIDEKVTQDNAGAVVGIYLDLDLAKYTWDADGKGSAPITLTESNVLLESIIPLPGELQGKSSYQVYRQHGGTVAQLPQGEASKNADGEYFTVNAEKTVLTVYAKKYSTYAIAYTETAPYYPGAGSGTASGAQSAVPLLNTADHVKYIDGYRNGTVGPGRYMTRAEAAQMFCNLLLDKTAGGAAVYTDVPGSLWCAKAVGALTSLGILKGFGDGSFRPDAPVTRAQFCAIAVRFAGSAGTKGQKRFSDVEEGQWYYRSVMAASALGWISGCPDGTFAPDDCITRAQAVSIVNAMLGRSADRRYADAHADTLARFSDLQDSGAWYYYDMIEATVSHDYERDAKGGETWTGRTASGAGKEGKKS